MQYITTTALRTKTPELIKSLKKGGKISLIHRSEVIGEIKPLEPSAKTFDVESFKRFLKDIHVAPTTPAEREQRYRDHLQKKYGKNIR